MPATFTCETCYKTFSRKGDLGRHQNQHTGYKPFECTQCGKFFSQLTGLKTHWNVHTGSKPYNCGQPDCDAAFGDPSSRARHIKETHCTSRTYRCPVADCRSSIKRKSAFNAHLKKKHNLDPNSINVSSIAPEVRPLEANMKRRKYEQEVPSVQIHSEEGIELFYVPTESKEEPGPRPPSSYRINAYSGGWHSSEGSIASSLALSEALSADLYTLNSPSSTPPLSHSQSSSPAPTNSPYLQDHGILPRESMTPSPIGGSCYQTFSPETQLSMLSGGPFVQMTMCDPLSLRPDMSWDALFFGGDTSGKVVYA